MKYHLKKKTCKNCENRSSSGECGLWTPEQCKRFKLVRHDYWQPKKKVGAG